MIFYERLGVINILRLLLSKKPVFYGTKSFPTRLLEKLHIKINARMLSMGDVQTCTDVKKNAYQTAELCLDQFMGKQWAKELSELLAIDFSLIAKKVLFNELCIKYNFIEVALKYAQEHPNELHIIYIGNQILEPYKDQLEKKFKVKILKNIRWLNFFPVLLLPIYLKHYWKKNAATSNLSFNNQVICKTDDEILYEMFSNLFQSSPSRSFVIEKEYAVAFSKERLAELQIKVLGLTKNDYLYLRHAAYQYISRCLMHYGEISKYSSELFLIFYTLIKGKEIAIEGKGNIYFFHEHMIATRAARNEFLRSSGNQSVFVPMQTYVTYRYYHEEIFINCDVMCVVGKHHEDLYKARKSVTNVFLPTGSYVDHRGSIRNQDKTDRVARLKSFKRDSVAITILSPGISDQSYSYEVSLMKLARELSQQQGVKVFIRMKPVKPITKYADFYATHTAGCNSILLTFSEYELFDFLEVTDLFVTSISSSACDMALRDGQVMFVDFIKDPDLYLCLSVIKEVVLTEEESFQAIMAWVKDSEHGQIRAEHKKNMHKFSNYLGYQFPDFDSYKANLLAQLRLTFKNHPALVAIEEPQSGGYGSVHSSYGNKQKKTS